MDWLQVFVLAIIQGLTEFLPVSSSAHLIFPSQLLGWPDQGLAFDVAMHVGSLAAVIVYFRQDIRNMTQAWFGSVFHRQHTPESHMAWAVIWATIPAGLAGLLFGGFIEENLRSMTVIACTTLIFGLLLGFADRKGSSDVVELTWKVVAVIAFAQALALIPGTSRSGVTMTAALLMGLNRQASAQFSFLLSIPLIVAAGALLGLEAVQSGIAIDWLQMTVATLVSAITAYLCIHYFLKLINQIGFMPFVVYRLLLAAGLFWMVLS
ncbi:Undecaprenyl-diphosphatase [Sinobacterium norvegicum]|uniref:Undecaprenyl-diphosphatase n=1 Tax=Sinobacterium norvegicum TaxID=1641715 RepID=A0ABM9AAZ2_9GAMM|nr:undecaprenyl-diphosphate phosphatase [Sinobacterium norvegicum]CAH0990401.1 Undecaprenyl-diphosphatase [Sinobacterium norvegicum]